MANFPQPPDIERFLPPPPDQVIGMGADAIGDVVDLALTPLRAFGQFFERGISKLRGLLPR